MSFDTPNRIITFYSYKGGTGRTMALANVACLLAHGSHDKRGVLMMDWDLEAPGLHRFFRNRFERQFGSGGMAETDLEMAPGIIDIFWELHAKVDGNPSAGRKQTGEEASELIDKFDLDRFILETDVPSLYMIKAGRLDKDYPSRVTSFQWAALYDRSPWLFRAFAERLAERFRYVLIDSRTGETDISGICTMLMPEKLVVVFTPSRQSLWGVKKIVVDANKYRDQSADQRDIIVYPLPSRIEPSEPTLRDAWRLGDKKQDLEGYQPMFEKLFSEVYGVEDCDLSQYFNDVQIQHIPPYAYGENLAVLVEQGKDRLSLTQSYKTFKEWLIDHPVPWKIEQSVEIAPVDMQYIHEAEAVFAGFTVEEQEAARRLFTRLVRLADDGKGLPLRWHANIKDLPASMASIIDPLSSAKLLTLTQDVHTAEPAVTIAREPLLSDWPRLRQWIEADRKFLLWQQQLRSALTNWERSSRDSSTLLRGHLLDESLTWLSEREADLTETERTFIVASRDLRAKEITERLRLGRLMKFGIPAAAALIIIAVALSVWLLRPSQTLTAVDLSRRLAKQSAQEAGGEPDRAMLLAVEAVKASPTPEAEAALRDALIGGDQEAGQAAQAVKVLSGHSAAVNAASFSPDARLVVTASSDTTARIWDSRSGALLNELKGHNNPVKQAAFNRDGNLVLSVGSNDSFGAGRVWEAATGKSLITLSGQGGAMNDGEFSPTELAVVTASSDNSVRVWKPKQGSGSGENRPARRRPTPGANSKAAADATGGRINPGRLNKSAHVWTAYMRHNWYEARLITVSLDGNRTKIKPRPRPPLLTGQVTDPETNQTWVYRILKGHTGGVRSASFDYNRNLVVTASDDNTARIWDANTGQSQFELKGHMAPLRSASFSPFGALVVTASEDKTARVWDASTGKLVAELKGHTAAVRSAVFSSRGKYIVTASDDGTARVWENLTWRELVVLRGHQSSVTTAEIDDAEKWVVTASEDGTARLWQAVTGQELGQLTGHQGKVLMAKFSPDSRFVVTAGEDGTARIYNCERYNSIEDLLAIACSRLRRNLSREEWQRYLGADVPYRRTCSNLPDGP